MSGDILTYLRYPLTPEASGCIVEQVDAGKPGALQRACLEAALPRLLAAMYPDWDVFEAAGEWHACRRGHFPVHAGSPAGLWAKLGSETDKETTSPILADAGDGENGSRVPSARNARVHAQGHGPDGTLLAVLNLRHLL